MRVIFLLGLLACVSLVLAIATAARPINDELRFVLIAPWADGDGLVQAAGGRVIGPFSSRFGVFAASDDAGFNSRLRNAGAWAVLDGTRLAELCGIST